MSDTVIEIKTHKIYQDKMATRVADKNKVRRCVRAIQAGSIQKPIFVKNWNNGYYTLLDGLVRLTAYRELRIATIPCIVKE